MKKMRLAAAATLVALLATLTPRVPALANGAASTRNIILGGAAATLLIINHNRKVHERYAEDAAKQAALAQQRNDAWAAYRSEKLAYQREATVSGELKREVAYQHSIIEQQRKQLAMAKAQPGANFERRSVAQVKTPAGTSRQVAVVSYGWGSL
ncbi:MAG TPA: hypothetical protein VNJ51_10965 [Candidatus Dormibacteraeota bacterium]|nr:hypothetical protein [Candidatus Dormibacteraeota bacterium]